MRPAILPAAALVAALSVPAAGVAQPGPARETVARAADEPVTNAPGKRLVSVAVTYPPGGVSLPHRQAGSAFLYAYVLEGEIRSQVDNGPARVYRPGEGWFERPGAHHRVSENASDTRSARLLAVFIVDVGDDPLTIPDHR
jgi:quercetin dioxygenase-like cupin family protein